MNRTFLAAIFCLTFIAGSMSRGQAPGPSDEQTLVALLKEVQAQQTQIADNQAKIEAKLAELAEAIRVARIFTSRER
jgi:hypothetical protein